MTVPPSARSSPLAQRAARLDALASTHFDVLVVGGGITGCGIARDAALRGLRVALVEKDDFASGTSSRSSRLIHGGLRYLEHGELHLVFEASAERRRLLRLAPHLVHPLDFLWPVYAGARVPRWKLEAGLTLYDALALFRNVGTHRRLSVRQVATREPGLRREGLLGGARYFDAATDDARLTLANALGAAEAGAVVLNHAPVRELLVSEGTVTGACVVDAHAAPQRPIETRARVVVNATGPWSDALLRLERSSTGGQRSTAASGTPSAALSGAASARASAGAAPAGSMEPAQEAAAAAARGGTVHGSKGVHIAVPRGRVGNHGALTLLSPRDGRVMFVLPGDEHTIIGTTDTYTTSSPDEVRASTADVRYLLESANAFFPAARLSDHDVVSAWAGIRPLVPSASAADPDAASREHAILRQNGVVTITGGKLTTYRIMALDVVDAVCAELGRRTRRADHARTRSLPLPGGDIPFIERALEDARGATGDDALARRLVHAYGSRWPAVWDEIRETDGATRLAAELPYTLGEMRYAVRREMACTLADLLVRRTHLAFETRDHARAAAPLVAAAVAALLHWRADDVARALDAYDAEVRRIFTIET